MRRVLRLRNSCRPRDCAPAWALSPHCLEFKRGLSQSKSVAEYLRGILRNCQEMVKADTLTKYLVNLNAASQPFQQKSTAEMIADMYLQGCFDRNMAYELFDNVCTDGYLVLLQHYILEGDRISALDVFKRAVEKKLKINDDDIEDLTELCSKQGDGLALKAILQLLVNSNVDIPEKALVRCVVPLVMLGESKFLIPLIVDFIRRTSLEASLGRMYIAFCIGRLRRILGSCQGKLGRIDVLSLESLENAIRRSLDGKKGISRYNLREACIEYACLLPTMATECAIAPMCIHNFPYILSGKLPNQVSANDVDCQHRLLYSASLFQDDFQRVRRQVEMKLITHLDENIGHDLDTDVPTDFSKGGPNIILVRDWLDKEVQRLVKDDDGYVAHCMMAPNTEVDDYYDLFAEDDLDDLDEEGDEPLEEEVS